MKDKASGMDINVHKKNSGAPNGGRLFQVKTSENKTLEAVKTAVMTALFFAMILLLLFYISQMRSLRGENFVVVPIEQMLVVRDSGETTDSGKFDFERVLPEFIGYKSAEDRSPRGIFGNEETVGFIYKSNARYLNALFSGAQSSFYEAGALTGERLWNSALQSGQYLYVKYASALPYPVINSYLTGSGQDLLAPILSAPGLDYSLSAQQNGGILQDTKTAAAVKTAYIKEIFIVLVDTYAEDNYLEDTYAEDAGVQSSSADKTADKTADVFSPEYSSKSKDDDVTVIKNNRYKYYGIARDESGNIAVFSFADESTAYYFDINAISAYDGNRDFVNYEFYNNLLYSGAQENAKPLADTAVITDARVPSDMVLMSKKMEISVSEDDGTLGEIASYLGYSKNKYTRYTENGATEVFVSQNGFLRITPESGKVTFEATGKSTGIALSELANLLDSGKTMPGKSVGVYELIDICESVIGNFSAVGHGFSGGEGRIGLNRIYIEDGCIVVKYGYYFSGAAIVGTDGSCVAAYSFRIYNNTLISFSANYCDISYSGMSGVNYSTAFITDNLDRFFGKKYRIGFAADYRFAYVLDENSAFVPVMSNFIYVNVN